MQKDIKQRLLVTKVTQRAIRPQLVVAIAMRRATEQLLLPIRLTQRETQPLPAAYIVMQKADA